LLCDSLITYSVYLFNTETGELNGEDVAVKVAKREYTDEAMKEVETMAAFSHQNILHLIGIVRHEGRQNIVCKFVLDMFAFS
jgi:hypothetical protein